MINPKAEMPSGVPAHPYGSTAADDIDSVSESSSNSSSESDHSKEEGSCSCPHHPRHQRVLREDATLPSGDSDADESAGQARARGRREVPLPLAQTEPVVHHGTQLQWDGSNFFQKIKLTAAAINSDTEGAPGSSASRQKARLTSPPATPGGLPPTLPPHPHSRNSSPAPVSLLGSVNAALPLGSGLRLDDSPLRRSGDSVHSTGGGGATASAAVTAGGKAHPYMLGGDVAAATSLRSCLDSPATHPFARSSSVNSSSNRSGADTPRAASAKPPRKPSVEESQTSATSAVVAATSAVWVDVPSSPPPHQAQPQERCSSAHRRRTPRRSSEPPSPATSTLAASFASSVPDVLHPAAIGASLARINSFGGNSSSRPRSLADDFYFINNSGGIVGTSTDMNTLHLTAESGQDVLMDVISPGSISDMVVFAAAAPASKVPANEQAASREAQATAAAATGSVMHCNEASLLQTVHTSPAFRVSLPPPGNLNATTLDAAGTAAANCEGNDEILTGSASSGSALLKEGSGETFARVDKPPHFPVPSKRPSTGSSAILVSPPPPVVKPGVKPASQATQTPHKTDSSSGNVVMEDDSAAGLATTAPAKTTHADVNATALEEIAMLRAEVEDLKVKYARAMQQTQFASSPAHKLEEGAASTAEVSTPTGKNAAMAAATAVVAVSSKEASPHRAEGRPQHHRQHHQGGSARAEEEYGLVSSCSNSCVSADVVSSEDDEEVDVSQPSLQPEAERKLQRHASPEATLDRLMQAVERAKERAAAGQS